MATPAEANMLLVWLWQIPAGAALNPARALGPAIAFWNFRNIWVYLLGTFMGGMSGAIVYENLFLEVLVYC